MAWLCIDHVVQVRYHFKSNENYHNHELKQILGKSRRVFQLRSHGKFTKQDRTK